MQPPPGTHDPPQNSSLLRQAVLNNPMCKNECSVGSRSQQAWNNKATRQNKWGGGGRALICCHGTLVLGFAILECCWPSDGNVAAGINATAISVVNTAVYK